VFFNLFAAAELYISVTILHGTPCNGASSTVYIGRVEFSGCLGTDVPSGVKKQRTCGSLDYEAYPLNADDKAAGKRLV